jgi:DNA-binding response OmpR family regulator
MARVLVIDDDSEMRAFLKEILESEGHEVVLAADGDEGLAEFRNHPADVVMTDLFMPNKEGLETIRELLEEFPHAGIIAMCGRPQASPMLSVATQLGAAEFLCKPFSCQEILVALEKTLRLVKQASNAAALADS